MSPRSYGVLFILVARMAAAQVTVTVCPLYDTQYYPWHDSNLSRDGSTVVAANPYFVFPPQRWTPAGGTVTLPSFGSWITEIPSVDGAGDVFLGSAADTLVGTRPRILFAGVGW